MDGGTETVQFKAIIFQISETNSRYQVEKLVKQKEKQKTVVHDNNKKERKERKK